MILRDGESKTIIFVEKKMENIMGLMSGGPSPLPGLKAS